MTDPWVGKIPWRREWLPIQYSCLEYSWTMEPGRLLSMDLQRVRHELETELPLTTHVPIWLPVKL